MPEPRDVRDVFFSHASEDKEAVVRPLAAALKANGFSCWLDEDEIRWGESLAARIQDGLSKSRFVIVVLSSNSVGKYWPERELDAALYLEASSSEIRLLLLLVGDAEEQQRLLEQKLVLAGRQYQVWASDPGPIVDAIRSLKMGSNPVCPSGLVSCKDVRESKWKLPGEVFVIELLKEPIVIERSSTGFTVTVDRRHVDECIISNEGKNNLIEDRVTRSADVAERLGVEDREVQKFLTSGTVGKMTICPRNLGVPLRWASGGVLSLVKYKQREWVPLFFRDIRPYGWNISLGSTERRFNEEGQLSELDAEHRFPWDFISREFLEESMVINREPGTDDAQNLAGFRTFISELAWYGHNTQRWRKYADFRRQRDHLNCGFDGLPIHLEPVRFETQTTLRIRSRSRPNQPSDLDWTSESNVLVCFSLLDLGIEVVKVFSYELDDGDYLLDGEIDHENCLVRMPMALFSLDYLEEIFSHEENWYRYVTPFGNPPSIEARRAPSESEIVPFLWDVAQRIRIIDGDKAGTEHERNRFAKWRERFGHDFLSQDGRPSLANPSRLFVPGTAKILNLYFSNLSQ